MDRILKGTVEKEMQLGTFLSEKMELTRRQISQAKFRDLGICVNGNQRRVNYRLKAGDVVTVRIEGECTTFGSVTASKGDLDIIWEDQDLLVVNKPAGLVTHPSHGHYQDTLANFVAAYLGFKEESFPVRPIGRLDKDTSGLVLFAKNQVAAARLAAQRESGVFFKTYLAVVSGRLEENAGTISIPMRKVPGDLIKMEACEKGELEAKTSYRVLKYGMIFHESYSVVEVRIHTGRTHQIRVHFSTIGHPLLGDLLYGERICRTKEESASQSMQINRTALHAWRMDLCHPFQKEGLHLEAPFPEDMKPFLQIEEKTGSL